jgi:hypothetical protein
MTTIILQTGWVVPLMGRATNGSCHNGPPASCAGLCYPTGWSGGPSTIRWLVPCQAQPIWPGLEVQDWASACFFCRRIARDGRESAARCFVFARELVCMTLLFSRARERACCARFCFFLLVQVFDHLAWNIMSTSFDLKLDPPNSKCYLILYPSYKYFDIILLLLYLFLIFILNRF